MQINRKFQIIIAESSEKVSFIFYFSKDKEKREEKKDLPKSIPPRRSVDSSRRKKAKFFVNMYE